MAADRVATAAEDDLVKKKTKRKQTHSRKSWKKHFTRHYDVCCTEQIHTVLATQKFTN